MDFEVFGILFLVIVAPLWIIFHYSTRWRAQKTLSSEDEQLLSDLWRSAERMEGRMTNLERILETEDADWRSEQ